MNIYTSQYSHHHDIEFQCIRYRGRSNISSRNKASFICIKWDSKIFICWWGCFHIRFDLLPYSLLQAPAPPAPPPPRRTSRMISKPTASASSIGGRKPKYATHHEHQKAILLYASLQFLLKYTRFSHSSILTEAISSVQCRASAPQWHWCSGRAESVSA